VLLFWRENEMGEKAKEGGMTKLPLMTLLAIGGRMFKEGQLEELPS